MQAVHSGKVAIVFIWAEEPAEASVHTIIIITIIIIIIITTTTIIIRGSIDGCKRKTELEKFAICKTHSGC